jgi:integrase
MKEQTIEEAIEEVLARPQSANTMKNMRQVANKLLPLLESQYIGYMSQLNEDSELVTKTESMNSLIEVMKVEAELGSLGRTYNTVQSRVSRMRLLLQKAGLNPQMVAMLKDAESVINRASGLRRTQSQATITPEQAQKLIEFGELLSRGELPEVLIQGRTPTACKIAQGHTYTLTSMCYALRHESLMEITWGDVTPQSLIYITGKGNDFPEEHLRTMEPILWTEIVKLQATWKEQPDSTAKLFINESWLYAYIRQACEYAGIERTNGRYGLHRARRAFATWCFSTKGINLEDASAGLNHTDTAVTERVYIGLEARQMRGNETLGQFREEFLGLSTEMKAMKADIKEMKTTMDSVLETILEYGQPDYNDDDDGSPFQIRTGVL